MVKKVDQSSSVRATVPWSTRARTGVARCVGAAFECAKSVANAAVVETQRATALLIHTLQKSRDRGLVDVHMFANGI